MYHMKHLSLSWLLSYSYFILESPSLCRLNLFRSLHLHAPQCLDTWMCYLKTQHKVKATESL